MSTPDTARSVVGLLRLSANLAISDDSVSSWRTLLTEVRELTQASGVWIRLTAPEVLVLRDGSIPGAAQLLIDRWIASGPETGVMLSTTEDGSVAAAVLSDERADDVGFIALVFDSLQEPPRELVEELRSVSQALVTICLQREGLLQTQRQLSRFQHLYEVGQVISSTLDLDQVLRQSTERVAEVLYAEACTLMLIDEAKRELVFKVPAGPAESLLRERRMPLNKGVAGWVAAHGEPIIIADVTQDERFYVEIDALSGFRTQSIMAVPLQVQGKTIGILEVINKTGRSGFTPEDQQWLSILAPLIAAAIENARLFTVLKDDHNRIIMAEEKVRHELARDLHDGPAQILAAIVLNIDMARRHMVGRPEKMAAELNYLESLAEEANQEVRDLLFSLRPLMLETLGLPGALEELVERARAHTGFAYHLELGCVPNGTLPPRVASTLFVIIQEALNNIQRHAEPQNVWVRLGTIGTRLWVEIEDDGKGFDVHRTEIDYSQGNSFGLLNMRERARLIDGTTTILSPPPGATQGTRVRVEVALSRECDS